MFVNYTSIKLGKKGNKNMPREGFWEEKKKTENELKMLLPVSAPPVTHGVTLTDPFRSLTCCDTTRFSATHLHQHLPDSSGQWPLASFQGSQDHATKPRSHISSRATLRFWLGPKALKACRYKDGEETPGFSALSLQPLARPIT